MTDLDHSNNDTADAQTTGGPWQIRFEPGTTKEDIARIADFAVAEGMCDPGSADFVRAGRDPRFWHSGALERAEVDAHREILRKALNNEPLSAADLDPIRDAVQRFDEWLGTLAYPRAEIYDADTTFFDFD
ncbi:hypothetical protein [Nocardia brasiliensis]|uniref:hypothetical protein n=1 Tax=Nocardia brasiliensis TaxID=37326 RepID=UPI00189389C1|nr:hypothetical protein [Nocardia brasiliensis]MBF6544932.1 hypothetical protein [Nocardia brasiliensis]